MANMRYCVFENTSADLADAYETLGRTTPTEGSQEEQRARKSLIKLCVNIALDHGHEIDQEVKLI